MPTDEQKATQILLLEDENFIGELYKRALTNAGYQVDLESSGKTGLALAAADKYDIILLDLMLPELSGLDILKHLRGGKASVHAKIIVITNMEYHGPSREAIERLADGYLLKADTTPRQLLEYLKNIELPTGLKCFPKS